MSGWPVSGNRKVQRESERQPCPQHGPCGGRRKCGQTVALTPAASEHLSTATLLPERSFQGPVTTASQLFFFIGSALRLITGRRVQERCECAHVAELECKTRFFLRPPVVPQ